MHWKYEATSATALYRYTKRTKSRKWRKITRKITRKPIFKLKHFEIRVMNKENPSERALNFKVNVLNTLKNWLEILKFSLFAGFMLYVKNRKPLCTQTWENCSKVDNLECKYYFHFADEENCLKTQLSVSVDNFEQQFDTSLLTTQNVW